MLEGVRFVMCSSNEGLEVSTGKSEGSKGLVWMLEGARFVLCSSNEGLEGCGLMLSEAKDWLLLVLLAGVRFALRSLQCRTLFEFVRCPQLE